VKTRVPAKHSLKGSSAFRKNPKKKTAIYFGWATSDISRQVLEILSKDFKIVFSHHCAFEDRLDQEKLTKLSADFLFSFGPLIVRKPLLESISLASINLHTAPPRWPGRGSVSFALFHGDKEFGVTAHLMNEEVDSGPILRVLRFPILKNDSVETIHEKTLRKIPELTQRIVDDLKKNDWKIILSHESWKRKATRQRDLLELMQIKDDDSDLMIARKVRAFAHSKKPGPYFVKGNYKFWFFKNGPT
jgi:methionyl-tRNA formyltransferase